jgi:hypothetical protein
MSIIVQQDATVYSLLYFCKLLYMLRVVTPPIIRSTYNRNYSIWHWSNRPCYVPLWWRGWNGSSSSNLFTIAEGSRDGLTRARCCNYGYMCSWWWMELPPETCRAVYKNILNCIQSHLVGQLLTLIHDARAHEHTIGLRCTLLLSWR